MAYQQVQFTHLTQAQYDALAQKNPGMLYFTSDTGRIYKGTVSYTPDMSGKMDIADDWPLVQLSPTNGVATLQDRAVNRLDVTMTQQEVESWVWESGQNWGTPYYDDGMWYMNNPPGYTVQYIASNWESTGEGPNADKLDLTLGSDYPINATVVSISMEDVHEYGGSGTMVVNIDGHQVTGQYSKWEDFQDFQVSYNGMDYMTNVYQEPDWQVGQTLELNGMLTDIATLGTTTQTVASASSIAFPSRNPSTRSRRMMLKVSVPSAATTVAWPTGVTYVTAGGGSTPPSLSPGSSRILDIKEVADGVFYVDDLMEDTGVSTKTAIDANLTAPEATINSIATWAAKVNHILKGEALS